VESRSLDSFPVILKPVCVFASHFLKKSKEYKYCDSINSRIFTNYSKSNPYNHIIRMMCALQGGLRSLPFLQALIDCLTVSDAHMVSKRAAATLAPAPRPFSLIFKLLQSNKPLVNLTDQSSCKVVLTIDRS
jgi:hypothetical protein